MRQDAWGAHRRLGAVLGLWMAFQGLTGLVLLFGDTIGHWRDAELTRHGPGDRGPAEALAVVRQNYPGEEVGVLAMPAVSDGVYVVQMGERDVFVDPAGPRINGVRDHHAGFVALVRRLHRRFLFDSLLGVPGVWVVAALATAWLVVPFGGGLTAAFDRLRARRQRDPSALEGLLGVLLVAPIVLVVVTGIRLAVPAGTDRIWAAVTGSGLARADVPPEGVRITAEDRGGAPLDATEVIGRLGDRYPGATVARLLMPRSDDRVAPVIAGISVGFDPGRGEHDHGGNTVVFVDQYSGETLWTGTPDALPAARQAALLWSRPLHTGSVAGDRGRILWGGLAAALLTLAALDWVNDRRRPAAVRRPQEGLQRQVRRRKALTRRKRVHAARAARAARLRRRTSRHLRRRRKVQGRIRARVGRTPPAAAPPVPDSGAGIEIDLTDTREIDLTDRAGVDAGIDAGIGTGDRSRFPPA